MCDNIAYIADDNDTNYLLRLTVQLEYFECVYLDDAVTHLRIMQEPIAPFQFTHWGSINTA